uniref:RRM domain-containing protein n=1 Tax=Dunaliella tertiolecta TaxID=3047 RepID=A0A7S3VNH5_DUNTE
MDISNKAEQPTKARRRSQGKLGGELLLPLGVRLGNNPFITHLHLKEHRNAQSPSSLFVAGIPLGMSKRTLEHIASCFGETLQTVLHGNKKSGMVAFVDEASVAAALEAASHGQIVEIEELEEDEDEGTPSGSSNEATGLRGKSSNSKGTRKCISECSASKRHG